MSQMNQRVRSALSIQRRPARPNETKMLVETERTMIGLIYVGRHLSPPAKRIPNEQGPYALAVNCRINEQRLHVTSVQQHERERAVVAVDRQQ